MGLGSSPKLSGTGSPRWRRLVDPAVVRDASLLGSFRCSAGHPFEDDVESWVRNYAAAWLNDVPRAVFQRRQIAFIEDVSELVTVAAWQDIVRVDLDGILFYNAKFLELVKGYWRCGYAKPTLMLFNICGPHQAGLSPHLDATTFRGVRIENTPVWMQNIMVKSGLFTDYLVKMAQVITWCYRGEEGTFTYWPDGPLEPPRRLQHPLWNRGVVVQNELMFHRGDAVGRPDQRAVDGLKHRSLMAYSAVQGRWEITTDGAPIRTYDPAQIRFLAHWNAEVYADMDEVRRVMDHTDDLTHQMVVDRLLADMRAKNVAVSEPNDPLHDLDWIHALMHTYTIAPTTDWNAAA